MPLDLTGFEDTSLTPSLLDVLLNEHEQGTRPELERLWAYYRNPRRSPAPSPFATTTRRTRQAQEEGLPARLRSPSSNPLVDDRSSAKEIVIENDIGWRVDAMVDFVFGKPLTILSTSPDPELRAVIERTLDRVWESSGGVQLLQDMALLGGVYGFADLVVRTDELFGDSEEASKPQSGATTPNADDIAERAASSLRIELIEGTRAVPVLDPGDYRRLDAYIIRATQLQNSIVGEPDTEMGTRSDAGGDEAGGPGGTSVQPIDDNGPTGRFASRLGAWLGGWRPNTLTSMETAAAPLALREAGSNAPGARGQRRITEVIEVISPTRRRVFRGGRIVLDAINPLNELPVVHIQNASQPFAYAGISDVEPLIALQDELNTRLSDRAHRVTMQSFNMYLAKGLDGFGASAVGPGQVWSTDNQDASVQPFGGDAHAPSEQAHVEELRDAMDKASGVSPVALGVIRAKLGHLSSENALRITLNGVLSKTSRKRVSYGRGIAQVCRIALKALDAAGVLKTSESDRGVRLHWQDPLPLDERARLNAALLKRDLGVPVNELLAELGYAREDAGVG
jgi:hypothetical protein